METNSNNLKDFEAFLDARLKASTDFLNGKIEPLNKLSVQNDPASIFPPNGICIAGAREVNDFNQKGAANFLASVANKFETLHKGADEKLAYWTGVQRAVVNVKGKDEPVAFNLRLTEIFRKEDGAWKLMHRHADNLNEENSL